MKSYILRGLATAGRYLIRLLSIAGVYFSVELFAALILSPDTFNGLLFGACWAICLASLTLIFSKRGGRIFFGITYYFYVIWALAQTAYSCVFHRMMWLSDIVYAGEGAGYLIDVLAAFPAAWWIGGFVLLGLGAVVIWKFPRLQSGFVYRMPYLTTALIAAILLFFLPERVFLHDLGVWGTRSEYAQSSSYRATYNTMYDAGNVYDICGIYQLTFRDIWKHELYPLTPAYRVALQEQTKQIDEYFAARSERKSNDMTGIFTDKNVVMVLMESIDDWMITQEDTPTLYGLINDGIYFDNFYTPGYGTARTINTEFCINTGIYLPTNGNYVFDYVTNDFSQSVASQATQNGFTAEVFHYNSPDFYSRGVFEPAMGYDSYNCYEDYETDKNKLYDDSLLFDIPELNELFFRQGKTFNTIITRSAHLSYVYNEVLSNYALKKYPQYRGKYASQEEDCARVKAKLVDDMFARLLQELVKNGQLENTVIIGVTDHYTYGYKNMDELYALSGTQHDLLLEKTPFFVWSPGCSNITVHKTLNTADFVPTVLNLLGIESPYNYLGQDAFDPDYEGYALFSNGSWISDGVACVVSSGGNTQIVMNDKGKAITEELLEEMAKKTASFIQTSNLLLTSDYYKNQSG